MDNKQGRRVSRRTMLRASGLAGAGLALGGGPLRSAFASAASVDSTASFTPANAFFNAHHSPIGAYATFTLGYPGANGGFGLQQKLPGAQGTFVGVQKNGQTLVLPFFDAAAETGLTPYPEGDVTRDFRVASDSFKTSDLSFTLFSPVRSVPDPTGETTNKPVSPLLPKGQLLGISTAGAHAIEDVLLPAIFAELVVDNSTGSTELLAVFAVEGGNAAILDAGSAAVSFGTAPSLTAIATDHAGAKPFVASSLTAALAGSSGPGAVGGITVSVAPGAVETIRFALGFHVAGAVTGAIRPASFWFTKYYSDIHAVMTAATTGLASRVASFSKDNGIVDKAAITANQKFLLAQAIRSYYGNTAFLQDAGGQPWWVVLEGQYQYMNTFDLTVDQQFFELGMNPWTVRNELEHFAQNYSYQSGTELVLNQPTPAGPGGISFTHDQGQWPNFTPDGSSAYEKPGVFGTFSFMTGEQLTNWILIAGVYVAQTNDRTFFENNVTNFEAVLTSLMNRDNGGSGALDGIQSYNSTKCSTNGQEITTYDSVGPGLEEAVGNTYLGGKTWAAYVILEGLLALGGRLDLAALAVAQAGRAAAKITSFMTGAGYIASNVYNGESIPIIPVIEALVYPYFAARRDAVSPNGLYGSYVKALGRHLTTVLQPGICLTPDSGWQLDSESDNTWLSKIFLNEFVGREVLGLPIRANTDAADTASVDWLTNSSSGRLAFSDQIENGIAIGSEYYPRGVTSILWLQEPAAT